MSVYNSENKTLTVGICFSGLLIIPPNTKILIFNSVHNFEYRDDSYILEDLYFGKFFNKPIKNVPDTLVKIFFGYSFYQSIDFIKDLKNLKTLVFDKYFNKPIDCLPTSIKILTFGHYFNKSIERLRELIELNSLTLGYNFTNSIVIQIMIIIIK